MKPPVNAKSLLTRLPAHLRERGRWVGRAPTSASGSFVLYWMRTALRAHDNPALEAALALALDLGQKVFVYQGLSERASFASDRHHWFILEGARDVADELAERGIGYALHVEREGHRGPHLRSLALQASVVVTEDFPLAPLSQWTERLAQLISAPVLVVDTACVVPMRLVPWPLARAFEYRRATAALRHERLATGWPALGRTAPTEEADGAGFQPELPFEPVDPCTVDFSELLSHCRIDHSVAPVCSSRGGHVAGYERWEAFIENDIGRYHRLRNDPLADGVSRMSAYLHYGMVSPFRLAAEAVAHGSAGAEKYLDELLIWRELAYAFCCNQSQPGQLEALPSWAQETLRRHQQDARPSLLSMETLSRAQTGDSLWDVAQLQLLRHGELHNNVRMTWGKALLGWRASPGEALRALEELNHRYALDGRDPASYGGILWCFGLFDRPFEPEKPVLGTVRPRPTHAHARRLDVELLRRRASVPSVDQAPSVLVVGAGASGLLCARTLADAGLPVQVLDKGRRPGGRLSARTFGAGRDQASCDHGAQYFTVRDPRLRPLIESCLEDGVLERWQRPIGTLRAGVEEVGACTEERLVGVPDMNAFARHLARDLEVESNVVAERVEYRSESWEVRCDGGRSRSADYLVLALPAPQAASLLPEEASELSKALASVTLLPCLALSVAFEQPLELGLDGAFVAEGSLSWVARNSSKPKRPSRDVWVLHANPQWSARWFHRDVSQATARLLGDFAQALGRPLPRVTESFYHRWRFARTEAALGRDSLFSPSLRLGLCGDWCLGARLEGALTSGVSVAGHILRRAAQRCPPRRSERQLSLL